MMIISLKERQRLIQGAFEGECILNGGNKILYMTLALQLKRMHTALIPNSQSALLCSHLMEI